MHRASGSPRSPRGAGPPRWAVLVVAVLAVVTLGAVAQASTTPTASSAHAYDALAYVRDGAPSSETALGSPKPPGARTASLVADGTAAGRAPTTPASVVVATNAVGAIEEASNAAFKAADNVGDFTLSAKHLPGAGGNWNRFAAGVDPDAAIAQALRSPSAQFRPNGEGTFKVVTDLGFQVGEKSSQTGVRVIVTTDGRIITAFPVKP